MASDREITRWYHMEHQPGPREDMVYFVSRSTGDKVILHREEWDQLGNASIVEASIRGVH